MNVTDLLIAARYIDLTTDERFEWQTEVSGYGRRSRTYRFYVTRIKVDFNTEDEGGHDSITLRGPGILAAGDGFQTGAVYRETSIAIEDLEKLPEPVRNAIQSSFRAPAWMDQVDDAVPTEGDPCPKCGKDTIVLYEDGTTFCADDPCGWRA